MVPEQIDLLVHPPNTRAQQEMLTSLDTRQLELTMTMANPARYGGDPIELARLADEQERVNKSRENLEASFSKQRQEKASRNEPAALEAMAAFHAELLGTASPSVDAQAKTMPIDPEAKAAIARDRRSESDVRDDLSDYARLTGGLPSAELTRSADPRASYRRAEDGRPALLNVGSTPVRAIIFHELGHGTEYEHSDVADAARAFRDARARFANDGQVPAPKPLNELVPGGDYRPDEMAVEGGFPAKYRGKTYSDGTTEIVSTGMEQFANPERMLRLFRSDPEHFEFMLGVLSVIRGKS